MPALHREERDRAFLLRSIEVPWTLVKGAWVLVLFTVETVGGGQGGRKEAETRGTALRPASVVPVMSVVPFFHHGCL